MIIYNTTKFDGAEIKKSILADNKYKLIKQLIIFGVLFILGSILLILGLLYETTETVFTMGIGLVIFSILYFLFSLFYFFNFQLDFDCFCLGSYLWFIHQRRSRFL